MEPRTIPSIMDDLTAWVAGEIAPGLEFLVPPEDAGEHAGEVATASPAVYQAFVPGEQRLAEGEHQAPSIAVQLLGGADSQADLRKLDVRLLLIVWAPGHFGEGGFTRDRDGWRDLYNGLEAMSRAVESAETVAGCAVDHASGVRFGFYDIDGEIPDQYPYWVGKVDFALVCAPPATSRFENLL